MVKRYLGGVISGKQITTSSQSTTGFFNLADQMVLKNKSLWELVPSWDLFRARYNSTGKLGQLDVSILSTETEANAFFFKPDGTALYFVGGTNDTVYEYRLTEAWDVTTAAYNRAFLISTQELTPHALFFSPDGLKMYVMGQTGDDVNEYSLSTAWNISTASYVRVFSVGVQETSPTGLFFRADGLRMYVLGSTSDKVHEYALSTAWNVSTATLVRSSAVLTSQDTTPTGIFFRSDGTRLYVVGSGSDSIYEYSLSTAWDVSTIAYVRTFFLNYSGVFSSAIPADLQFNDTGDKVWVLSGNKIQQFNLSTPWNISSMTLQTPTAFFNILNEELTSTSIFFKPDGTQMFMVGSNSDSVYGYTLSTPWDINTASKTQSISVSSYETAPNGLFFDPDGTKMYIVGQTGSDINYYTLSTPWDLSTVVYQTVTALVFTGQNNETLPTGLFFKPDGTEFYTIGTNVDQVQTYVMSTPWIPSTRRIKTPLNCLNIQLQEAGPAGAYFRSDGLRMYLVGNAAAVYEYHMSTAWDVHTAVNVSSFSVSAQETTSKAVYFSSDGLKMYVTGQTGDDINEYNLSTAWDVTTAVYSTAFSINTQVPSVTGVFFSPDGLKMYFTSVASTPGRGVYEYTLSTAWNTSTATYTRSFITSAQDTSPQGLFFKPDGTRMYVLGNVDKRIFEYSLSTAWNVSTASYVRSSNVLGVGLVLPTTSSLSFKADGTEIYFFDFTLKTLVSYTLTVAWDISTTVIAMDGSYGSYSVASQDSVPQEIFFKSDGTKMYILGSNNDNVYEYTLSTAWDVATATLSYTFSVGMQDIFPTGMFFKPDGNTMYISGSTNDAVYAYDLS